VVGGEERVRIGLHPQIPLVETAFDGQGLVVLAEPAEEFPLHPKCRRAV
jgi:hypothetical protein